MYPENEVVKQYRLWIRLPGDVIGEATGDELALVKDIAQRMTNGGARFEPQAVTPATGSTLIFHPSHGAGKTPCGWISAFDVPKVLSNEILLENLKQQAA
jgi:hypothetical protein